MLGPDVADDGLDSRMTLHLAPDTRRDPVDFPEIQTLSRFGWLWPRYLCRRGCGEPPRR